MGFLEGFWWEEHQAVGRPAIEVIYVLASL